MSDDTGDGKVIVLGDSIDEVERKKREHAARKPPASGEPGTADPVAFVRNSAHLFRDQRGTPMAAVRVERRTQLLDVQSKPFDLWLRRLIHSAGFSITRSERRDLRDHLESVARFDSPAEPVFVRVGETAGRTYLDLGSASDKAIEVTPDGWRVMGTPSVRFRATTTQAPLPRPDPDCRGAVDELREYLNVDDGQFPAVVGWILAALRVHGPYPVLFLQGEQGTGKSTAAKMITSLVDPRRVPLRTMPKTERDLAVAAQHAHLLAYDNLSALSPAMSDALCRVSTGGGLATRKLHTDAEEVVLEAQRPVIATGIPDLATRPDLAERAIVVRMSAVRHRVDERRLLSRFAGAAPRIFGSILDGVVSALARVDLVTLDEPPRMADFALWVTAAEAGLGWAEGTILAACRRLQSAQVVESFESDPVASLVPRVIAVGGGQAWRGSASSLLELLRHLSPSRPELPRACNALTAHLRRVAPVLRACGYGVRFERSAAAREVVLEASSSSSSSP